MVRPAFEPVLRRTQQRYVVSGEIMLSYEVGGEKYNRSFPVLNISSRGLGVKGHDSIPEGTKVVIRVTVHDKPVVLLGRVVHSTIVLGGYHIGIDLCFPEAVSRK
jgi:hypothetical protein